MILNIKVKNNRRVKLMLELIEVCSKNGNLALHKALAGKEFSDAFLKLLKRVSISRDLNKFKATREDRFVR